MLETCKLEYDLPKELIATTPAEPRDRSKLLVVSRSDPDRIEDRVFTDLPELLVSGDRLVFNTTSVMPARLMGKRRDTGGRVDGLYISGASETWTVALRANGKLRSGIVVDLDRANGGRSGCSITLDRREDDLWVVRVDRLGEHVALDSASEVLRDLGATPLPPYILGARREVHQSVSDTQDRQWYQTVYADQGESGSIAAPTAGLHFTPSLMRELANQGIGRSDVVLHVGRGTFRPIESQFVEEHPMHVEEAHVSAGVISAMEATREAAGRLICVGTTSVRAIESLPMSIEGDMTQRDWTGETDLLIAPGYAFKWTDGLITNFHLPRSTLLALVAALMPGGIDQVHQIYAHAIEHRYRFYSYGDAMLILP